MADINLESIFALIQEIKQGIKQKCYVELFNKDVGVSETGLCIRIQTKNYKTKEFMYFERIITEKALRESPENAHHNVVRYIIDAANDFFRKEQEIQNNADYCPCCDSHTCTCKCVLKK
jgi:hypothetical protein